MRKVIIGLLLFLAPAWLCAQTEQDNYDMYAQYLRLVKTDIEGNANFVVRESTDYGRSNYSGISRSVEILHRWYEDGQPSVPGNAQYQTFLRKIKEDTTLIGLMVQLDEKMSQRFVVENRFPPDLHITIISDEAYHKIFSGRGSVFKAWGKFDKKYPGPAYIINLSAVVSDGKRALFYFSRAWAALAGYTSVVFFEKENGQWIYVGTNNVFKS
ncbi:hypothetical protein [uncultured Mucilaginibacter sp.]|uniref:hypothetical protein n=1 Tax=uncultured Mucilaginibacter sp. TaxID=797541 RepID=UPI0025DFCE25|nr:hypothetical protein [uncultured Mucilaginibacter sp.]